MDWAGGGIVLCLCLLSIFLFSPPILFVSSGFGVRGRKGRAVVNGVIKKERLLFLMSNSMCVLVGVLMARSLCHDTFRPIYMQ